MKSRFLVILAILNVLSFGLLSAIYYFGFDLQWGVTRTAITWGLPVAIASLITLTAGVFTFKRNHLKWGVFGLGVATSAITYMVIMVYVFSYMLLPPQDGIPQDNPPTKENTIIAMILSERFDNGGYTVVSPYTVVPDIEPDKIKARLDNTDYDFTNLIERLFEINQTSEKLNLNSSPEDGYYIDYDGIFSRYTGSISDVPLRWNLFHPQAKSNTEISIPAYDPETGYFVIYIQTISSSLFRPGGSGAISAYKYLDGELTFIDILVIWVR